MTAAAKFRTAAANVLPAHADCDWWRPATTKHTRLGWQQCRAAANAKVAS